MISGMRQTGFGDDLTGSDAVDQFQDMADSKTADSLADKGGLGITLDLDRVPVRETGMTAYEIMLSESQERMLMVLRPGRLPRT